MFYLTLFGLCCRPFEKKEEAGNLGQDVKDREAPVTFNLVNNRMMCQERSICIFMWMCVYLYILFECKNKKHLYEYTDT